MSEEKRELDEEFRNDKAHADYEPSIAIQMILYFVHS